MAVPAPTFRAHMLDFYAWAAPQYEAFAGGAHARAATRLAELAAVAPHETALDCGCGTGLVTSHLGAQADEGGRVIAADISPAMLAVARAAVPGSAVAVALMDAHDLPLRDSSCDVVTFGQVLPYLDDPGGALAEALRVLRRGGRLAVSTQRRSLCTAAEEGFFRTLEEMASGFRLPRTPDHHRLLGEPWAVRGLIERAGFEVVHTTQLLVGDHTPDASAWLDLMMQAGPYPYGLLSLLRPAGRARFERRVDAAMRALGDSAFTYHRGFTFAVARRP